MNDLIFDLEEQIGVIEASLEKIYHFSDMLEQNFFGRNTDTQDGQIAIMNLYKNARIENDVVFDYAKMAQEAVK